MHHDLKRRHGKCNGIWVGMRSESEAFFFAWGGSLRAAVRIPGLRMTYNIMEQCNIIVGRQTELLTLPPLLACASY